LSRVNPIDQFGIRSSETTTRALALLSLTVLLTMGMAVACASTDDGGGGGGSCIDRCSGVDEEDQDECIIACEA